MDFMKRSQSRASMAFGLKDDDNDGKPPSFGQRQKSVASFGFRDQENKPPAFGQREKSVASFGFRDQENKPPAFGQREKSVASFGFRDDEKPPPFGQRQKSVASFGFRDDEKPPPFGQRQKSVASFGFRPLPPPSSHPPPVIIALEGSAETSRDQMKASEAALLRDDQDRPTPLDFDAFLPWICKQMGLPEVVKITRFYQDRFVLQRKKHGQKKKAKIVTSEILTKTSFEEKPLPIAKKSEPQQEISENYYSERVQSIPLKVYYDNRNRLAEIAVTSCEVVRQKFIKAIDLCLPFHPVLTKMSITKCSLDQEILYEIGQLNPHSNFTEMIFDDTYVKQGNYYLVLNKGSQLKHLSLNRCTITDEVVKEICQRIDIGEDAGKCLQILELSCNLITDLGAFMLGNILKKNRVLLHINLAGNQLTDEGATFILDRLKKFMLTEEDIIEMRDRKREYFKKKAEVYERCYGEQQRQRQNWSSRTVVPGRRKSAKASPIKGSKGRKSTFDIRAVAQMMTDHIMGGPFKHLFDDEHITRSGGHIYCNGNFHLCSLNIAYNNMQYHTLKKLNDVLKYQSEINKPAEDTGLIRITLEGNLMPYNSQEFIEVDNYLKKAIALKPKNKSDLGYTSSIRNKK